MKALYFIFLILLLSPKTWAVGQASLRNNLYDEYQELIDAGTTPEVMRELNRKVLSDIYNYKFLVSPGRLGAISWDQAQFLLHVLDRNPVVSLKAIGKYDPGNLGFCFGRATFIHLELLRRGVQKEAIKKVFAIGPMQSNSVNWQFHVATMVKGPQNAWLVIDPFFSKILLLEDWFEKMSTMSVDGRLKFFISEPAKMGPSSWEYNIKPGGMYDEFYRNYFKDMFEYFRRNPLRMQDKFR